jgi:hypothetical protein
MPPHGCCSGDETSACSAPCPNEAPLASRPYADFTAVSGIGGAMRCCSVDNPVAPRSREDVREPTNSAHGHDLPGTHALDGGSWCSRATPEGTHLDLLPCRLVGRLVGRLAGRLAGEVSESIRSFVTGQTAMRRRRRTTGR